MQLKTFDQSTFTKCRAPETQRPYNGRRIYNKFNNLQAQKNPRFADEKDSNIVRVSATTHTSLQDQEERYQS